MASGFRIPGLRLHLQAPVCLLTQAGTVTRACYDCSSGWMSELSTLQTMKGPVQGQFQDSAHQQPSPYHLEATVPAAASLPSI